MPLDDDRLEELKSSIAFARKRPLAFGLCLGKAAETTVLLSHKTKDPETVGRQAKKEGETSKLVFGTMTVEGKCLNLLIQCDPIPGVARKAREMLKSAGLKLKVRILDPDGNLLEEHADPEDEEEPVAAGEAPEASDPKQEEWDQTRPRVQAALAKAGSVGTLDLKQALAAWQDALGKAADREFAGAVAAARAAAQLIAQAAQAAAAIDADRARWQATAAKLGPIIDGLSKGNSPEVKKLLAYWSFATSKALATVPDFASVMKVLPQIIKLIGEIRAAPQAAPAPAPGTVNGAPPVTPKENARLAALSEDELLKTDLTLGDTKSLFSEDYMKKLKGAPIKGEGSPDLKKLMQEIAKGFPAQRRDGLMKELEAAVGTPPTADRLSADYDRFLVVRKQQAAAAKKKKKDDVEALDEKDHPDFMASRSQLQFGKVLGDAFGIHPVFACLLSPTGGLVGPGNTSVQLDPDNPVALHGVVHDAAGHLKSYFGEGPGYTYRDEGESILEKDWLLGGKAAPLTGQFSGIAYWTKEAVVEKVEKTLKPIRDEVEAEVEKKIEQAKKFTAKTAAKLEKLAAEVEEEAVEIGEAIREAPEKLERAAVETFEESKKKLGEMADDAKRKLEAAWDFIWN